MPRQFCSASSKYVNRRTLINILHVDKSNQYNYSVTIHIIYVSVQFVGALMFLNEATLLNNLRNRYKKDKIYVSL